MKWRRCRSTLAEHNETFKLELPRAWELLDSSQPSQVGEGSSSHCVFFNGDMLRQRGF